MIVDFLIPNLIGKSVLNKQMYIIFSGHPEIFPQVYWVRICLLSLCHNHEGYINNKVKIMSHQFFLTPESAEGDFRQLQYIVNQIKSHTVLHRVIHSVPQCGIINRTNYKESKYNF